MALQTQQGIGSRPYCIVVGNEKGGTGKSTIALHLIVGLLRQNWRVGSIDTDARQGSLTRYIENRKKFAAQSADKVLGVPEHIPVFAAPPSETAAAEDEKAFHAAMDKLSPSCDIIVVDTPGAYTSLSCFAHSFADTLITPLNDSLIDLDMLVRVEDQNISPSKYAETVWEEKKRRAMRDGASIDWIILRNRLTNIYAKNKQEMEKLLQLLSKRIGARVLNGFGERVIFRELFLQGITLLDLRDLGISPSISHIAARQEISSLIDAIQLPMQRALEEKSA